MAQTKNSERPVAESGFRPNINPNAGPGDDPNAGWDKAEYATPERSGLTSGFYTGSRGLPWHVALSRQLDTPELMQESAGLLKAYPALVLAGADFKTLKLPLGFKAGRTKSRHAKWQEVPRKYATVRSDTMEWLGIVGEGYRVLHNEDAFAFADALVDSGDAHYETAGVLWGGRVVFLSMEVPDDIHVEGDPSEYRLFLLVSNGHDGSHAIEAMVTIERVVCRNTLRIAKSRALSSWKIRHTASMEGRLAEARQALGITFRYAEAFGETASALVAHSLAERQVDAILREAFPLTEAQEAAVDKDPDKMDKTTFAKVRAVYQTSPSVEPVKGTAYGVLNAVTEYVDHVATYQGRQSSSDDVKLGSLMFGGSGQQAKDRTVAILQEAMKS